MKKEDIIYVTAQPDVPYFHWQIELYVHNFISLGIDSNNIHVILSLQGLKPSKGSERLKDLGCQIHFYKDERNNKSYIPSIKPYLVSKWLEEFPQYGKVFFLHDADIIFREIPNFEVLLNDDISYLSDTIGYIGYNYIKDCCDRYEKQHLTSNKLQLLREMCDVVGVDIDVVKANQNESGGGQYLIKNTDFKVWDKIYLDCYPLYMGMLDYQNRFPINLGQIQFWTAEMWSTLWNLWKFGIETKVVKELDFSWATDGVGRYYLKPILHMAGVTENSKSDKFYKGDFINVNPIDKLRQNPKYFDYINSKSSTIKYIEVMKSFINRNIDTKLIKSNKIYVDYSSGKGRGVFCSELIKSGEIIEECHVIPVPSSHYYPPIIDEHLFTWSEDSKDKEYAICLGFGSIFNSSSTNFNASWENDIFNEKMIFKALRDIKIGEEILTNYNNLYF